MEDIVHVSFLSVEKHLSWLEDDGRAEEVSAPALKYSHIRTYYSNYILRRKRVIYVCMHMLEKAYIIYILYIIFKSARLCS